MRAFNILAITLCAVITILLCTGDRSLENNHSQSSLRADQFSIGHSEAMTQTFTIRLLDRELADYLEAVKGNPDQSKAEIFEKKVIKPVGDDCFRDGEYLHWLNEIRKNPPAELVYLEKILNDEQGLMKVKDTVKEALAQSAQYLPGQATTVCIMPTTSRHYSGLTIGSGKILMLYQPYLYPTEQELAGTVAHEYHHSVWTAKHFDPYQPFTLLDAMLFEGKAMYFQEIVYPNSSRIPNYDDGYGEIRNELIGRLGSIDTNIREQMMFGNEQIPYAFGYSEGYRLVRQYLQKNPNVSMEQWTGMKPEEFLKKDP